MVPDLRNSSTLVKKEINKAVSPKLSCEDAYYYFQMART